MISAIALDLGTTSIKAGLLDRHGALSHIVAHPAPKISVNGGRYESDALAYAAIADQALSVCMAHEFISGAGECKSPGLYSSLGLCSQRSSFLIWEQASGKPVTPLISWQDNRGAVSCEALRAHENSIRDLTGLPLTPYYFAPKLMAVLQDNPDWRARLERGELLAGTLDAFLIWRWTGGKHFVTDASMAARTLLMDIRRQQWSPQLCELFGIPSSMLPEIKPSAGLNLQLNNGLILQASVGDQSAALIASVSEDRAEALVNLGTGCFVVRYLPDEQFTLDGYLRTLVYQDSAQHAHIAIEGTLNSIAAALAPYPVGECRVEDLALDDLYCLAEPSGLGAPYFRNKIGIRFSRPVEHLTQHQIASLLLEAVIFRVARILEDFHRESALERVYLSGGLSELICLQQGIARCVPFAVYRLVQPESSLCGAALLAAGMAPAYNRESERIKIAGNAEALPEKYRHWKKWLDDLLGS
ncbi:MAG: FGGY family carbohydrate kinase [Gallionella sp.]|nr:FGGY family carbohydrate kinase [Gallionella sp.]